ncbi:zinc metalloprotease HtpX [Candidatus Babeliales bacterium]|nr:zinc metalloprotease HtpX [Candidatus Babeliales bacterium]
MILNHIKTILLLSILSGLFLLIGGLTGGKDGLTFAFIMALLMNGIMYFFSDTLVLKMYQAQPLDQTRYGWVYDIVRELTKTMKLPMPKLWIVNTRMANAFATGRSPKHASVAVTSGILEILNKEELRGVLAHELSHIKNRDTLVITIAATIATAIGYLANMIRWAAFWGSMSNDRNRRGNPLFMIFVAMLMPLAAMIVQLALSRSREFMADETGAKASHNPLALASALEKIHDHMTYAHLNPQDNAQVSMASIFIMNPFSGNGWTSWFSTHPPVQKRVARLRKIYEAMVR